MEPTPEGRKSPNILVRPSNRLRARLDRYAATLGLTFNAAIITMVDDGLSAWEAGRRDLPPLPGEAQIPGQTTIDGQEN